MRLYLRFIFSCAFGNPVFKRIVCRGLAHDAPLREPERDSDQESNAKRMRTRPLGPARQPRPVEAMPLDGFALLAVSLVVSFLVSFASVWQRSRCPRTVRDQRHVPA